MKKRTMIQTLIAGSIGLVAGFVTMLIIYPFIFPPPVLNEEISHIETKTKVAQGMFIHPNPKDRLHYGQGSVSVYKTKNQYEIFLGRDF
ncbi:hypothetical protein [Rickettsiella grylli]|uniref:hypothetical protein n=1 Tax=Rickettsiella grylli TaxID=59196 RepID=UPI001F121527|nr:hypothetical protein [Rickettsiella grylli]